jgi:uncharacterized protein
VIVVDLNLLLYAINEDEPRHEAARAWWESVLSDDEPVGLAWQVVLGFLRITTHARVMPHPISPTEAVRHVDEWFEQGTVVAIEPTDRHWKVLKELLGPLGTAGNLTSDAHLAALAIEHGARLFSTDNDFSRFPNLRWVNPLG